MRLTDPPLSHPRKHQLSPKRGVRYERAKRPEPAQRCHALLQDLHVWTHEPGIADLDGLAAEVDAADRVF